MVMVMDHRVSEHAVVLMEKRAGSKDDIREGPVSYTHLTLPTTYSA